MKDIGRGLFFAMIAAAFLATATWAQDDAAPDPQALLDRAFTWPTNQAVVSQCAMKIFDGKGGQAETTLRVIENQTDSGRAILGHVRAARNVEEAWFLSVADRSGNPTLYVLKKDKPEVLAAGKWQSEIGKTNLWPLDFLAAPRFTGARIVSGVNLNGQEAWLLGAEYAGPKLKYGRVNVWVLKADGRPVQINWLDKQSWPVRERRALFRRAEDGSVEPDKTTIRIPASGAWTEITMTSFSVREPFPDETFTPALLADREARERLWP